MAYKVIVSVVAAKNIDDALEYYKFKASKKVALDFLIDYWKIYKAIQINPFYKFHNQNYRFLPFAKFPFVPFFIIDEVSEIVFLNAIFDT